MADYYGTDTVVSELREDGLLIIRINRPDVANALNGVTSKACLLYTSPSPRD